MANGKRQRANGFPPGRRPIDRITRREWQAIACVALAYSNREIAAKLGIGLQTVKNHMRSILVKTGMGNRVELALWAVEHRKAA
jgi:DNA-binding NarL/FixJ family response regulator